MPISTNPERITVSMRKTTALHVASIIEKTIREEGLDDNEARCLREVADVLQAD